MSRASFQTIQDKSIYSIDYSQLEAEEDFTLAIKETNKFREENLKEEHKGKLLMLVDFSGSYVYGNIYKLLKSASEKTLPYLYKQATFGIKGGKKVFLNVYNKISNKPIRAFDTKEQAIEWLLK